MSSATLVLLFVSFGIILAGIPTDAVASLSILRLFTQPKCPLRPSPVPSPSPVFDGLQDLVEKAERRLSFHRDSVSALRNYRIAGILGHSGALTSAASLLFVGDGNTSRDVSTAVRYLRLAANSGNPDAHALLGFLYASGIAERYGIPKSEPTALLYWTIAAASDNIYALMALGFRHSLGLGVQKSCSLAARYYRRAARAVANDPRFLPSGLNFVEGKPPLPSGLMETPLTRLTESLKGDRSSTSPDDRDLVHFFRHSADRGNAGSRTILGALYYFGGHGIEPNETKARFHLEQAANALNEDAHAMLGHLDMRARRNQSAYEHFVRGTGRDNNKFAHYALGMIFKEGLLGMNRSLTKAAMHFKLALDGGKDHAGASFELGSMLWSGHGEKQDKLEAFEHFRNAARHGNIQSMLKVGTLLIDGNAPGAVENCDQGVKLLKKVVAGGDWKTVFELATDRVHDSDWYGALHRYLLAAHAGIELGQYNAAFMLEHLESGEVEEISHWTRNRMIQEAAELYEFSALQGRTDSLIRSANLIYTELRDYNLALKTFVKAAQLRNAEGMVSLALMLGQGLGIEQDRNVAIMYLKLARKYDVEATVPVNVALVGFYIYWSVQDAYLWIRQIFHWFGTVGKMAGEFGARNYKVWTSMVGDLILLGALSVALMAVLIVRTKRIGRT